MGQPLTPDSLLTAGRKVYSVSEISHELKAAIESDFSDVWVRGEVANFKLHSSGHVFMSLKDESALIEAIIFRYADRRSILRHDLEEGMEIVARGKFDFYERRGQIRLIIEFFEPVGVGALLLKFEQLKRKLQAEGLFDAARKRPLPALPRKIGIVTSPTGAAIRDILTVLRRRFANVEVLLIPAKVQGEGSAEEIAQAIREMNRRTGIDVMIVGRGGGSIEDLWAFNEEVVARAIYDSRIPVISAVGHEIDTTIADFVADVRAPTPSAAAEMVVRSKSEFVEKVSGLENRLLRGQQNLMTAWSHRFGQALRVLSSPERRIEDFMMRLDDVLTRLENAVVWTMTRNESRLREGARALVLLSPRNRVLQSKVSCDHLIQRLGAAAGSRLTAARQSWERHWAILDSLSPLSILRRGYSIAYHLPEKEIMTDPSRSRKGDKVEVRLWGGELTCEIIRDPKQAKLI